MVVIMTRVQSHRSFRTYWSNPRTTRVSYSRRRNHIAEPLEPRMMLTASLLASAPARDPIEDAFCQPAADESVHVLFGPDTSADYIAQLTGGHGHDSPESSDPLATYQTNTRWGKTSTDGGSLSWGDATTITWSIVPDGTVIPGYVGESAGGSNFISFMGSIYGTIAGKVSDQPWFAVVESVFDRWSEISGLDFVYEPHDDGAAVSNMASSAPGADGVRGDIRISGHAIDGPSGTLAYNFFPDNGEMVIDTSDDFFLDTTDNSLRLRNVMAHETGHGIGLSHVEPVDGTKLMEPIASTSFDGPQHDDILAAHRLYGDEFESGAGNDRFTTATNLGSVNGRTVTIGENSAHHYVSIDGAADVDYFRFTAAASAQLTAQLVPLGDSYQQGAVGTATSYFTSSAQSDLEIKVYDANHRLIGQVDQHGLGETESLTNLMLNAGGEYFIVIDGNEDAAQLYELSLTVSPDTPDDLLDFHNYEIVSYGGLQDHSGSAEITDGGASLHLVGNRWTMINLPYTVTQDTVLAFDFSSTAEGEIHGIGFDSNTSISSGLTFRLYGTQEWGRDDFATYRSSNGTRHYEIPVGQFYTGHATSLVFVNDHDVSDPRAESVFSNIRIFERESTLAAPVPHATDDHIVVSEDSPTIALNALANDDDGGRDLSIVAVSAGSAGGSVKVATDGRIHYRPMADFNGEETFTYTARSTAGSSTATVTVTVRPKNDPPVANDNRYATITGHSYRLKVLNNDSTGVDSGESLSIVGVGTPSAGGKATVDGNSIIYTPAAGFVGTDSFTYMINDGTAGSTAQARVTVYVQPAAAQTIDLGPYRIDSYGGTRGALATATAKEHGRTLRLPDTTPRPSFLPPGRRAVTNSYPTSTKNTDWEALSRNDFPGQNRLALLDQLFALAGQADWLG